MRHLSSIVVGIDYSPTSRVALQQAARIAGQTRAGLSAISVVDTLVAVQTADELSALQQQIIASLLEETRTGWGKFKEGVGGAERVDLQVEINSPAAAIAQFARAKKADLVVLGTHGASVRERGVGAIASSVAKRCPGMVLLVQQSAQAQPFRCVVAAIDFSATSKEAFDQAVQFASMDGAALHVVYAYSPPWEHMKPRAGAPEASPEFREAYAQALGQRVASFCDISRAEAHWAKPTFHAVPHKNHGQAINEFAKRVGADLVVLGSRGTTNLREVLMGSTAERVVRDVHCSVLVVHPAA